MVLAERGIQHGDQLLCLVTQVVDGWYHSISLVFQVILQSYGIPHNYTIWVERGVKFGTLQMRTNLKSCEKRSKDTPTKPSTILKPRVKHLTFFLGDRHCL